MKVLHIQPEAQPEIRNIGTTLEDLQGAVGGYIETVYPFDDPVVLVCNEEGKINGLPLNRALKDDNGDVLDVIAGDFFICGDGKEGFTDLSDELAEKYRKMFQSPEAFLRFGNKIVVVPIEYEYEDAEV